MTEIIGAKALQKNPHLSLFEPLIGEWKTTGHHPYFPDTELKGRAIFEWVEGGAFVRVKAEIDHPEFPDGVAIFGSDDETGEYYQLYFDERGVSRKYDVSITDTQLVWWRNNDSFSQRFTMTIEKDRLVAVGQMLRGSGDWEEDLSVTYERI